MNENCNGLHKLVELVTKFWLVAFAILQYLYGHANKAFVVVVGGVVVACQKQKKSVEGGKEYNVCRNTGTARGVPTEFDEDCR